MDPLDRLSDKIDTLSADVSDIKVTLAVNTASLQEHMARTQQLEDRVSPLEESHVKLKFSLTVIAVIWGVILGGGGLALAILEFLNK